MYENTLHADNFPSLNTKSETELMTSQLQIYRKEAKNRKQKYTNHAFLIRNVKTVCTKTDAFNHF